MESSCDWVLVILLTRYVTWPIMMAIINRL